MKPIYSYIEWNQDLTKCQNERLQSKKGDPWGDLDGPKATLEQQLLLFLLYLLKKAILLEWNMPKITLKVPLGQPALNQKKAKLKLVKKVKKEPRKASFPTNLGFPLGNPMWCALIAGFYLLKIETEI